MSNMQGHERLQRDVASLDRLLDTLLNHHLDDERQHMRESGMSEKQIRAFMRDRREQFQEVKHFALAEAVSFVTGTPFARTTTLLQ